MLNRSQLIELVSRLFPGVEFRDGYIGNVERWGDDRMWKLFTDIEEKSSFGGRQTVAISLSNGSEYDGSEVIRVLWQLDDLLGSEMENELNRVRTFLRLAECA